MSELSGKVALVTGAGSRRGFGRAIAVRLSKDGADIVVVDKDSASFSNSGLPEDWKGINSVVNEVTALGRRGFGVICDISRSDDVGMMVEKILDKFGQIDILVNNAGVHILGSIQSITDEVWHKNLSVNLTGTFFCSRTVAREMIKRNKGGKIINIASLSGKRGKAGDMAYCASKFGVIGLTQSMALELASYGINVNAICPTIADTDIGNDLFKSLAKKDGITSEEVRNNILNKRIASIPLRRLTAVEDVANVTAFLASKETDFITGQAINVCGGSLVAH